jgi:hypothetical protein
MKRSRFGIRGLAGSIFISLKYNAATISASEQLPPTWPALPTPTISTTWRLKTFAVLCNSVVFTRAISLETIPHYG